MKPLDIGIVGAGTAGLAVALGLARAGHRPVIHERFGAPEPVGSGLMLQPTGLTALDALGLLPRILALGSRIDRLDGRDAASGRRVLDVRYDALPGQRFGLGIHRAALFGVLHDAVEAEGIAVQTSFDAVAVEGGRWLVDRSGRRAGPFDLVVDASGARSNVRRSVLGAEAEPRPLPYGALWTTLPWQEAGFDDHALQQRYRRAAVMIGIMPSGRTREGGPPLATFFWSQRVDGLDDLRRGGLDPWKAMVRHHWPDVASHLDGIGSMDQMTFARYGHHTLRQPVADRYVAIGDAAHSTSPQLGQGANMALLDAHALVRSLGEMADLGDALASYGKSRLAHVRFFQAMSLLLTPFYQSQSIVLPLLRDRLVATAARLPPAAQVLAALVSGTLGDPWIGWGWSSPTGERHACKSWMTGLNAYRNVRYGDDDGTPSER